MGRLEDKIAVITGAASGQGRAAAIRFVEEGASIGITDLDAAGLEETATLAREKGDRVVTGVGDITDPATIDAVISKAVSEFGGLNVLYNNAGRMVGRKLEETTKEDFDSLMAVNCYAQLIAIQRAVPELRKAGSGSIVNISSISGEAAFPQVPAYAASKAASIGLTKGVAVELGADKIRCNVILPGAVDTPMAKRMADSFDDPDAVYEGFKHPERQILRRMAEPVEIANVALFLASDESSFMTGAVVPVEGGWLAW
jgi:dihydroanticapsin dehydrogenase